MDKSVTGTEKVVSLITSNRISIFEVDKSVTGTGERFVDVVSLILSPRYPRSLCLSLPTVAVESVSVLIASTM